DLIPVAYRVTVDLDRILQKEVEQNLIVRHQLEDAGDVLLHLILVDGNAHALAAKDVTGADQDRISDPFRHFDGLLDVVGHAIGWIGNFQLLEDTGELAPVFGEVHHLERGTEDADAVLVELLGEFERRLAAEL